MEPTKQNNENENEDEDENPKQERYGDTGKK